mgnify:FL=1
MRIPARFPAVVFFALSVVTVSSAANADIVQFEGAVEAAKSWNISPPVDGKIVSVHFVDGQQVAKGDLLVEVDDRIKSIEVAIAESELHRANQVLAELEGVLARRQELSERDAVSDAALAEAEFDVEIARTDIEIASGKLDLARGILEAHHVRAPADGIISGPHVPAGTNFSVVESPAVATLAQLDPINVRTRLSMERVLTRLLLEEFNREDMESIVIELRLPNGVLYPLSGRVIGVGFELDAATGEGSIIIEFPNPNGLLRPGLPVVLEAGRTSG